MKSVQFGATHVLLCCNPRETFLWSAPGPGLSGWADKNTPATLDERTGTAGLSKIERNQSMWWGLPGYLLSAAPWFSLKSRQICQTAFLPRTTRSRIRSWRWSPKTWMKIKKKLRSYCTSDSSRTMHNDWMSEVVRIKQCWRNLHGGSNSVQKVDWGHIWKLGWLAWCSNTVIQLNITYLLVALPYLATKLKVVENLKMTYIHPLNRLSKALKQLR